MNHESEFTLRTAYLINRYVMQKITRREHDELDQWVCASFINQQIFELLTENVMQDRMIF